MADNDLSKPRTRRRSFFPKMQMDSEKFGVFAEGFARFMGTAKFLVYMTVFVVVWVVINLVGVFGLKWDPYPFILLNLFFSTQASYSAPLILLAQNRQEVRDKISLDEDRRLAAQSRADMDFLAREIASIRMHLGELATRDFVRSELRGELRDVVEHIDQKLEQLNESR
ncbi:DUF1003 domain-containing protein [Tessaracoccus sp. OH4464_COT-324]|uniref:DUF1003 domain-containing protein n=1 Tax=Tessaracoccus sp. OH4464_COT-324 TaxID=2491059 RepID=UPI000F63775D|nr:DUF1003 domain-containing protein [Tessaracoccus sp. OH4464_COT-324]RRD46571.1 DUF1003 domain-containing protein [Tessaracoccus sp. OH4464_COT-324]